MILETPRSLPDGTSETRESYHRAHADGNLRRGAIREPVSASMSTLETWLADNLSALEQQARRRFIVRLSRRYDRACSERASLAVDRTRDLQLDIVAHLLSITGEVGVLATDLEDALASWATHAKSRVLPEEAHSSRERSSRHLAHCHEDATLSRLSPLPIHPNDEEIGVIYARVIRDVEELSVEIEVALHAISGAIERRLVTAADIVADTPCWESLVKLLHDQRSWRVRMAAAEIAATCLSQLRLDDRNGRKISEVHSPWILRELGSASGEPQLHVLAKRSIWKLTRGLEPSAAAGALLNHLLPGVAHLASRDYFLQRHAVVQEIAWQIRHAGLTAIEVEMYITALGLCLSEEKPGELVECAIVELLCELVERSELAFVLLSRIYIDRTAEVRVSQKARAVGCKRAWQLVSFPTCVGESHILGRLVRMQLTDRSELVMRAFCAGAREAVHKWLRGQDSKHEAGLLAARTLQAAIRSRACEPGGTMREFEELQATSLTFDLFLDPALQGVFVALETAVVSVRPGREKRLRLRDLGVDMQPDEFHAKAALALALLARDDFGVGLAFDDDSLVVQRGDRFVLRAWRFLHEFLSPSPAKRQGRSHLAGRTSDSTLRAPPRLMDELSPTNVPGERVHVAQEGGWGNYLPTVDDVLDALRLGPRPIELVTTLGITSIRATGGHLQRLLHRMRTSLSYARLATLRLASLRKQGALERGEFARVLARECAVHIEFRPHDAPPPTASAGARSTSGSHPQLAALFQSLAMFVPTSGDFHALVEQFLNYALARQGGSQLVLSATVAGLIAFLLAGGNYRLRRFRRARAKIPLSIGGWGTRGKSGTERLKAGLFRGLGYRVFVKTTGCEAMFILSQPGQASCEILIHRPYDKATIWEQQEMVYMAANLGVDVFLWECMALNPEYTRLVLRSWMKDEYTTLTNAYPDHEDIQGPAGWNVADVISEFMPTNGRVFSSEENFGPMFRQKAKDQGTAIETVDPLDGDLLAQDLLDLFPYQEHPRNVALVTKMAQYFGIEKLEALVLMAENVLPDLGVLKVFAWMQACGRQICFINGMSANERSGALGNWQRTKMPDLGAVDCGNYIVTVVNNRDDRVARSQVFARMVVEDLAADAHLLVGTNVKGLRGYIGEALRSHLEVSFVLGKSPPVDRTIAHNESYQRLRMYLDALRIPQLSSETARSIAHLCVGASRIAAASQATIVDALARLMETIDDEAPVPPDPMPSLVAAYERTVGVVLGTAQFEADESNRYLCAASHDDVLRHLAREFARLHLARYLWQRLPGALATPEAGADYERDFRRIYESIFWSRIFELGVAPASGDQVIEKCLHIAPPGTRVYSFGMQNIKGTGLNLVYRWLSVDKVGHLLAAAATRGGLSVREFDEIEQTRCGVLEAVALVQGLEVLASPNIVPAERVAALRNRLVHELDVHAAALAREEGSAGRFASIVRFVEDFVDHLDSVVRARQARRVMKMLQREEVTTETAAELMRAQSVRQGGGWLFLSLRRMLQKVGLATVNRSGSR